MEEDYHFEIPARVWAHAFLNDNGHTTNNDLLLLLRIDCQFHKFLRDCEKEFRQRRRCDKNQTKSLVKSILEKQQWSGNNASGKDIKILQNENDGEMVHINQCPSPTTGTAVSEMSLDKKKIRLDISRVSLMAALLTQTNDEWEDHSKVKCLCSTTTATHADAAWWDRPLWAWAWDERLLAHGAMLALDLANILLPTCKVQIVVSSSRDFPGIDRVLDNSRVRLWIPPPPKQIALPIYSPVDDEAEEEEIESEMALYEEPSVTLVETLDDSNGDMDERASCDGAASQHDVPSPPCKHPQETAIEEPTNESSPIPEESQANAVVTIDAVDLNCDSKEDLDSINPDQIIELCKDTNVQESPETPGTHINDQQSSQMTETIVGTTKNTPELIALRHPQVIPNSKSPQIDSQGVDLTMLSQIPPNMRSEVRLAMAVKEQRIKRHRPNSNGLHQWLSTSTNKEQPSLLPPIRTEALATKKHKRSIQDFFPST
jgi:hypothetical protein